MSKVTRSTKNVHWGIPLTSESLTMKKLRNTTGRNKTWGVFKVYAVSLLSISDGIFSV